MCKLNPYEIKKITEQRGGEKLLPHFTEPYRVLKVLNDEGSQLLVRSIYSHKSVKKVSKRNIIVIPKNVNEEAWDDLKIELTKEAEFSPEISRKRLIQQNLEALHPTKRYLASNALTQLDHWKHQSDSVKGPRYVTDKIMIVVFV